MKVFCIDNKNPIDPHKVQDRHWIYEGEVYTVMAEKWNSKGLFYSLLERHFGKYSAIYHSKRFIPLSEVDEMVEWKEEKQLAT